MSVNSARHKGILKLIESQGFASTEDLVKAFNVTPQTIRIDIGKLANKGLLKRFHGGAGVIPPSNNESYGERRRDLDGKKAAIASTTAKLIPNGSSVFLNIGTTTEAVALALLDHQDLHVVTNNVHAASTLCSNSSFQVIMASGDIRSEDGGIVGIETAKFMDKYVVDIAVIGISGIDDDGSLLEYDPGEVRVSQIIIRNSKKVILVADSSKFGRRAVQRVGNISEIDTLVTAGPIPPSYEALLDNNSVKIIRSKNSV